MGLSGVVNALVRVPPSDLLTTGYGRLVVAKFVALCALGVLGWRQRRAGVVALQADPSPPDARRVLIRLALIEAAVFGVTFGIAVGLGRTPPPPPPLRLPTIPEAEIGYDFAGPPTVARILFDWRFDLIFGTAAIILAAVYVAAVLRLRRRGDHWPPGRIVAWLLGLPGLAVRDVLGRRSLHAGDVQHAHGRAHGAVDAGTDPAGVGRPGQSGIAGAARRRT